MSDQINAAIIAAPGNDIPSIAATALSMASSFNSMRDVLKALDSLDPSALYELVGAVSDWSRDD